MHTSKEQITSWIQNVKQKENNNNNNSDEIKANTCFYYVCVLVHTCACVCARLCDATVLPESKRARERERVMRERFVWAAAAAELVSSILSVVVFLVVAWLCILRYYRVSSEITTTDNTVTNTHRAQSHERKFVVVKCRKLPKKILKMLHDTLAQLCAVVYNYFKYTHTHTCMFKLIWH